MADRTARPGPDGPGQGASGRGVDRDLLSVYLDDHLAGAVAGARRMRRTADRLRGTPVGPAMDRVAREVAAERDELRELAHGLGLGESRLKEAMTWSAEALSRLKANGRWTRPSPMAPLLEVELLRSAVTGKLGIWQTLHDLAEPLGLDRVHLGELVEQSRRQVETLHEVHAWLRVRALRERPGDRAD